MLFLHCVIYLAKSNSGREWLGIIFIGIIFLLLAVFLIRLFIYEKGCQAGARSRDVEVMSLKKKLKEQEELKEQLIKTKIEYRTQVDQFKKNQEELQKDFTKKLDKKEIEYRTQVAELKEIQDELQKNVEENKREIQMLENALCRLRDPAVRLQGEARQAIEKMIDLIKHDTMAFPSVSERLMDLWKKLDDTMIEQLSDKAPKTKEQLADANEEKRRWKNAYFLTKTRIEVYEAMAPWLVDYMDYTIDEILEAKKEEENLEQEAGDDAALRYLSLQEYKNLTEVERNQLALDRYWDKGGKRNLWLVGIQYERYIGYLYENKGYKVIYHGALKRVEDLGVDLIATKGNTTYLIQCKRYSEIKKIPVRENAVAQIYGAAKFYQHEHRQKKVIPVMITSYELSDAAKRFASTLKVQVKERLKWERYPCIKCNINRAKGEKIYHLPFDQQYDTIIIEPDKGEFYADTVQEACLKGFRRAYRWRGNA